jgi:hypothetical protein
MKVSNITQFEFTMQNATLVENFEGTIKVSVEVKDGPEVNSTPVFDAIESLPLNNSDKVALTTALEEALDELVLRHLMKRGVIKALRTF